MILEQSQKQRREWMEVLAKSDWRELEPLYAEMKIDDAVEVLRKPETGLVMVRGRMGGSGQAFNTGEATVTRCTVRRPSGTTGHAYVLGRNHKHAMAAAQLDAALQEETLHEKVTASVLEPLKKARAERIETHRRKVAATKVDFFTLVRGEDD